MADPSIFLGLIRSALQDTAADQLPWERLCAPVDDHTLLHAIAHRTPDERKVLVQHLIVNALPLNLQVHYCATLTEAADRIAVIAAACEPEFHPRKSLVLHEHPLLRALPLTNQAELASLPHTWTTPAHPRLREHTVEASIGITVADWGIADSATIVQITRPGRPRSTSLVAPIHIALLPLAHLLADLAEAYAMIRQEPDPASWVLISGPSKTADIEACMVHGAHGPRALHLLVLDDPGFAT